MKTPFYAMLDGLPIYPYLPVIIKAFLLLFQEALFYQTNTTVLCRYQNGCEK